MPHRSLKALMDARRRTARQDAATKAGRLLRCRTCGADAVNPVVWGPVGDDAWWMRTRCGACGRFDETTVGQDVADRYDEALDHGVAVIAAAADRAERASFAAAVEACVAGLRLGLIEAEDFRA